MKKLSASIILAAALVAALAGCSVDDSYVIGKDNIDTGITLFRNGLEVPVIRNTQDIKVGDLIKDISDSTVRDLFKLGGDGKYEIRLNGYEKLDSLISSLDLSSMLKLDPISFSQSFEYEFGELDPSKFKSGEVTFGKDITLPDLSAVTDIRIPAISESVKVDAGIKGKDFSITMSVDPIKTSQVIFTKDVLVAAGTLSPQQTVSLKDSTMTLDVPARSVQAFSIPSDIKKINSVTLKSSAKLVVKLSLTNSVFQGGSIAPDVKVDLSDLLVFEGGSGVLDLSTMSALTSSNGFVSTKEFPIKGVNIDKLGSVKSVSTSGSVSLSSMTAGKSACMGATGDLGIDISLSFVDFQVESVNCDIKEVRNSVTKDVDIKINDINLPSQVKSVDYVTFSDASKMTVTLSAANLDKLAGLSLTADTLRIAFPSELQVSGDNVSGNVLTLKDVNLATGKTAVVKVSKLSLPAPVEGKVSFAGKINVLAKCTAQGSVNTSDLKKLSGEDVTVTAGVTSALAVADFRANIAQYRTTIPETKGTVSFEVPEEAASYGTFTITPQGSPAVTVNMTLPDLGDLKVSAGAGIKVRIPSFFVLGAITDPDIQMVKDTLILKKIAGKTYSIPVQKIVAKAVKDGDVYKVSGGYEVSGDICAEEGAVGMSTVKKISRAKIAFNAVVPSITASKLGVDSLSFNINEKVGFEALKSEDIPDMLLSAGEIKLDNVTANMSLDIKGMPSIGSSSKFMVDIKVTLPSFVKPSTFSVAGEIKDGKFTNKPLSITGFDLSGYDFQAMKKKGESIKGDVTVAGRIFAEKPEVELSSVSGKINGTFKADVSGPDSKITIGSLAAKVDYQMDTVMSVPFKDFSAMLGDVQFKLPDISAVIGMRSNLALPVSAYASVAPVRDRQEIASKTLSFNLDFPYSPSPEQSDTVTNTLSLNLGEILDTKPDSLKIRFGINTDKTKDCFVKPQSSYTLGLGYDVCMPLRFEDGFKLEIRDTLQLDGSLSGVEDILANTTFGMKGAIESTLPVGAKVTLEFLSYDEETGIYSRLPIKKVETQLMEPNSKTSFEIVTGPEKPGTEIPEITHMRFSIVLDSDGKGIGPDSYLRISNIALVLPEGYTINAQ